AVLQNLTVNQGDYVYDYFTQSPVQEFSNDLPETFAPSDGSYSAVMLENGPSLHRLSQDLVVPLNANNLAWDMTYINDNLLSQGNDGTNVFDPSSEFVAVNLRDPVTDALIVTLYKTTEGIDAESVTSMTTFAEAISAYRGRYVRLDFEVNSQYGYI